MRDVLAHIRRFGNQFSPKYRKFALIGGGVVLAVIGWLWLCSPFAAYEMLYSNRHMNEIEKQQVCAYLDAAHIDYKERGGGILVPVKHVTHLKEELLHQGLGVQKIDQGKGFELFDTNTWIKGEKELQVLEMRALKGQLEHDLTEFENIKHASVILDLAPARTFGQPQAKTKASVILTLMPHAHLGLSQLRAISYHLAGAVRGLESHMIAISDTKGRLYQAIDTDLTQAISDHDVVLEADLQQKIEVLLEKIFGAEHFYVTVQCTRLSEDTVTPHVAVVLNKLVLHDAIQEELTRQIQAIGRGCGVIIEPVIDVLPFERKRAVWQETKEKGSYLGMIGFSCLAFATIIGCVCAMRWKRQKPKEEEETWESVMTKVDISKLAYSLVEEDPETLALMLTYLEPKKAEDILASFPTPLQEKVLAELEKVT